MEHRHKARILAFKALYSWELNKTTTFTDITNIESEFLNKEVDSSFGENIFLGVIERIISLDNILKDQLKNWQIERLDKVDLTILRLSIYSLLYLKDISRIITINEAINISKEFGSDNSFKFINGILDSIVVDVGA